MTNTHGGARKGAGAKKKYAGETTRIYITVPVEHEKAIRVKIARIMKPYIISTPRTPPSK